MVGISTLGVGSGLDLNGILEKIDKAERKSLEPISKQQAINTAKLSAYGTLRTSFQAFLAANEKLVSSDIYTSTKASAISSSISVDAGADAIPGKYIVNVLQLAEPQTLTSIVKKDIQALNGNNAIQRTLKFICGDGNEKKIVINKDQTSLTAIRDAINKSDCNFSANLIKVSENGFRLSLTAKKTGVENALKSIEVVGDDLLNQFIGFNSNGQQSGMVQSIVAQNAKFTVNNVDIENSSNTIKNAIEGVTLTLNEQSGQNHTITVTRDNDRTCSAIEEWVDAYNSLQDSIASLTRYNPVAPGKMQDSNNGVLFGDGTLRIIHSQLMNIITTGSGSSVYKSLSQVGISLIPDNGKLQLDTKKLNNIITDKHDEIKYVFAGNSIASGIATTLTGKLTNALSNEGILQSATESINKKINTLNEQYTNANKKIDDDIARYKSQFIRLDKMLSKMNGTSSFLMMQLNNFKK
ncbi:FliD family flagellar hook-associated protein [Trabulsiella guamensis ATCC 49490]|uniref:Flagellar hook-associated protein 2 n=1 Tax=Trabulsiella guamensis ATCC 49490 TaxID=1005994 RepID=A0A085A7F2_9ENTR|nr:flagellar filament capping protein FliD [Trabulsiella guamensis]KFC06147.1 FliD family flagellar hook-associated protein [Trabulsiella guamensis ATCC 49490]